MRYGILILLLLASMGPQAALAEALPEFRVSCTDVHAFFSIEGRGRPTPPSGVPKQRSKEHPAAKDAAGQMQTVLRGFSEGMLRVQLLPKAAKSLHEFTAAHLGKQVRVTLGNQTLSEATLQAPVAAGLIVPGIPVAEAARLAETACPGKVVKQDSILNIQPSAAGFPVKAFTPQMPLVQARPDPIPTLAVGCDMVTRIELSENPDAIWWDESVEGKLYAVELTLAPEAARTMEAMLDDAPYSYFLVGDVLVARQHLELEIEGARISSDYPPKDLFHRNQVMLLKRRLNDAVALVTSMCPEKAPTMIVEKDAIGLERWRRPIESPSP